MFATLVGTDTNTKEHQAVFDRLFAMAVARGFLPPDTHLRVQRDQIPIDRWTLEQNGPGSLTADFLLAVTAPQMPNMSPIPVQKTISGPLFSVIVMGSYFVVWRQDKGDVSEFKDIALVVRAFDEFLDGIAH